MARALITELVNTINLSQDENIIESSSEDLLCIVRYCYYYMIEQVEVTQNNAKVMLIKSIMSISRDNRIYKTVLEPIFSCQKITNSELKKLIFMFSCFFNYPIGVNNPDDDMSAYYPHLLLAALYTDNLKLLDILVDANMNEIIKLLCSNAFQCNILQRVASGEVFKSLILNNYDLSPFNHDILANYLTSTLEITRLLLENNYKFGDYIYNYIETEEKLKLFIEYGYDINCHNCYLFERAFGKMNYQFCLVLLKYGANPKIINTYNNPAFIELKEKLSEMNINIADLVSEYKYM